jgi:hypothetical protein
MTRALISQTTFTAGELDPRMLGRTELRASGEGAARLRNVVVETTGGVRRRPGMAYIATAPGRGRLVAIEIGPEQAYLLLFTAFQVDVWRDGVLRATLLSPWEEEHIKDLHWAQHGASLIVTHPEVPAQRITRQGDTSWTLAELSFAQTEPGVFAAPFARFTSPEVAIQASGTSGIVTLTTSAPVWTALHLGSAVRIVGKWVDIVNVVSATEAVGNVRQALTTAGPTTGWEELAFSAARGWPIAVTFWQERMVIGGTRDLPNRIWASQIGRPLNFELGELADEAIAFGLASNDVQKICALVSGRHLQVFTSAGEWVVTGSPLTPTTVQVQQQSRVGSPRDRHVPPRDVDGATLFAARNGREIREFLFTNTEQAYQSADLALLSRHLVEDPVDQDFDPARRLFLIVMADGSLATIAIYRNADIAAWSRQETAGKVLSVAVSGNRTLLLVERANGVFLEQLDDGLMVDAGRHMSAAAPSVLWEGLGHLEGESVAVVADGQVVERTTVSGGTITLAEPAREIMVGLPYAHVIEPLPAVPLPGRAAPDAAYRPVRVTLRLFETRSVRIDTGDGLREVPLHAIGQGPLNRSPSPFTGDRSLRALGWRRGSEQPPWRIEQDTPLPCMLLSATTEVKVNN